MVYNTREKQAKQFLTKATFEMAVDEKKNIINMYIDAFIEEMEKYGKKHLEFKGDIERVDTAIKKLKKAMEKLSLQIKYIPVRGFKLNPKLIEELFNNNHKIQKSDDLTIFIE